METLEIRGNGGEPLPNTFVRQEGHTDHLAVILPGRAYSVQAPLLWFSAWLLHGHGADVLLVEYNRVPEFDALSDEEQMRGFFADIDAAMETALSQRSYSRVTLIGKSIGTIAMGHVLTAHSGLPETQAVWLTPLLPVEPLRQNIRRWGGPSLFVIGTKDSCYNLDMLADVQGATGGDVVVVEGADHIMQVENDVWRSLQELERILRAIDAFLR